MPFIILAIFVASILTALFYKRYGKLVIALLSLLFIVIVAFFSRYLAPVTHGKTFTTTYSWIESLHINLSFYIDGLSLFFVLLISVFGLLVFLYAFSYMKHYDQRNRFFSYLLFFMGAMLGVVLSANLISLFVFWELTSFSSFLLIGFNHEKKDSRKAARQALLITAGGGLALMSGFILLEVITSSGFNMLEILDQPDTIATSSLKTASIILIALGCFTKSAQFPFHFWLPNAMAAPTPVSAYLHSATMVKAGVYLILRLNPAFIDFLLWHYLLGIVGAITMIWGAYKALQVDDLKKILAYTTISALGIFFMMIGFGGADALNAVMIYILAHAFYKGGLFLSAGSIDHQAGTRNISELSGLFKKMPYTSWAVILCFTSMAGLLPFLGFVGKESLYDVLFHEEGLMSNLYLALLFVASVFFTTISIEVIYKALFKVKSQDQKVTEAEFSMRVSPLFLAIGGLVLGLVPFLIEPIINYSAASSYGEPISKKLKLWHGFNLVFLLSAITWATGVALFFVRKSLKKYTMPDWLSSDYVYDKFLKGIKIISKGITMQIQNGLLRNYIATILLTFSVLIVLVLAYGDLFVLPATEELVKELQIYEMVIFALIVLAVVFLFKTRSRLIVTATFGIIGYSLALAYTLFSAPDVAITQFLAETLSLILLILILHKLPSYTLEKFIAHKKYFPVAVFFGLVMSYLSFIMLNLENNSSLKSYFLNKSVTEGKGENAVNVILVDFRALDTLGEITVLAITMIGIIALLRADAKKNKA